MTENVRIFEKDLRGNEKRKEILKGAAGERGASAQAGGGTEENRRGRKRVKRRGGHGEGRSGPGL